MHACTLLDACMARDIKYMRQRTKKVRPVETAVKAAARAFLASTLCTTRRDGELVIDTQGREERAAHEGREHLEGEHHPVEEDRVIGHAGGRGGVVGEDIHRSPFQHT